jgi:3-isopropylmalate/(R)-2-methylmalate dehydratase small subunit
MEPVNQVEGRAVPFGRKNIDTDLIIPARWLKTVTREGLGRGAFETVREDPDNVFDQPAFTDAPILVAGDNFGCGSSREHAPWALLDFGIRCVISTSFGDIFYNNCFKNGILPIVLDAKTVEKLFQQMYAGEGYQLTVDLPAQVVRTPEGEEFAFEVGEFSKHCLINGLDDIGITLQEVDAIETFEQGWRQKAPWLFGALQ